ncbi:MAG: hypothetical protein J6U17_05985 [Kiritimatiellae bacterium]|nr:hypothetical protein [Kiritimatiellia bacterium]
MKKMLLAIAAMIAAATTAFAANCTIEDCSIYAFGAGPRPFCGSDSTFEGGSLSAARIEELTRDWPEVKQHVDGATAIFRLCVNG